MNILVIGGSYFYGKAFVKMAAGEHDVTVFNRGNVSIENDNVKEIKGDRHDGQALAGLDGSFDVIVDFCGYNKGDIEFLISNMKNLPEQYIFISTVDVYKRGISGCKKENTEYEDRLEAVTSEVEKIASYITGKIELEKELIQLAKEKAFNYTILRPAILYGEGNYAPRENLIIRYMKEAHILPMVVGAEGNFQMVYVEDAANAVRICLKNERCYNQCYNLCGDEILTYDSFYEALKKAVDAEYKEIHMNVKSAIEQGAPTPFPLTKEETELYSNEKSKCELGIKYTSIADGLKKTAV
ncbi:MAG: NAD-dependent epimerase/dehydratase family protein [Coprococcus sp.]